MSNPKHDEVEGLKDFGDVTSNTASPDLLKNLLCQCIKILSECDLIV